MADNDSNHDRYLRKSQALSRAFEISKKDKVKEKVVKGEQLPVLVACYRCSKVRPCLKHPITETGRAEGAVSVSNEYVPLCEECAPKRKKSQEELSQKQVQALLKSAKRGRL
jgi:hypothetical protein